MSDDIEEYALLPLKELQFLEQQVQLNQTQLKENVSNVHSDVMSKITKKQSETPKEISQAENQTKEIIKDKEKDQEVQEAKEDIKMNDDKDSFNQMKGDEDEGNSDTNDLNDSGINDNVNNDNQINEKEETSVKPSKSKLLNVSVDISKSKPLKVDIFQILDDTKSKISKRYRKPFQIFTDYILCNKKIANRLEKLANLENILCVAFSQKKTIVRNEKKFYQFLCKDEDKWKSFSRCSWWIAG